MTNLTASNNGNGHTPSSATAQQQQGATSATSGKDAATTTAAINGSSQTANWSLGIWSLGLINNSNSRYLTAETFGHKINANGTSLKKKQTFQLEPNDQNGGGGICLKSHLGRYLAVDQYGNVTCDGEEKTPGSIFEIGVPLNNSRGAWTLLNTSRQYYLGASSDKLICTAKTSANDSEKWSIHLAARPQVTLKSIGRKRYAHLAESGEEIQVDANVAWGADTLFTLEFTEAFYYAIHSCNNRYLSSGGKLQENCDSSCLFSMEYHHGQMALRDKSGLYLAPIGSKAILKTRSHTVTKDELFVLEDSLPQAAFICGLNGRYVSTKQGIDVTANQDEISDFETFQLEYEPVSKKWYIRTMQDKYWTVVEQTGGIQASSDKKSSSKWQLFDLIWTVGGVLNFRGGNGKYVGAKRSGHLYANCENDDDNARFWFYLINRPTLVLKCEQGYVGYKSGSKILECNKAQYETILVERKEKGVVWLKSHSGKYFAQSGDEITGDSDTPSDFFIELREPTRVVIKINDSILTAEKNGGFKIGGGSGGSSTLWEF